MNTKHTIQSKYAVEENIGILAYPLSFVNILPTNIFHLII